MSLGTILILAFVGWMLFSHLRPGGHSGHGGGHAGHGGCCGGGHGGHSPANQSGGRDARS